MIANVTISQPNLTAHESDVVTSSVSFVLALKGAKGDKGDDGDPGTTPHIGENGNWFIGSTDTGVHAQGASGVSPTIGQNGHWYVGNTDTGINAQGLSGNINYPTFRINDDMCLIMTTTSASDADRFRIDNGDLILTI